MRAHRPRGPGEARNEFILPPPSGDFTHSAFRHVFGIPNPIVDNRFAFQRWKIGSVPLDFDFGRVGIVVKARERAVRELGEVYRTPAGVEVD